ncbi:hypothetical protein K435DRAFT_307323 [Dendrothele bispora CBS 962.96]|uniref:Uncharacterized protein n=1 Tax=Dendrothele bispora (strain CBS 962.96) TaxID=1314807 RepID=A0A4S8LIE0_DENBC|nr:hypothetical protein K435DRAFT_307323 [Dendrothele bispora CBS 962.96]
MAKLDPALQEVSTYLQLLRIFVFTTHVLAPPFLPCSSIVFGRTRNNERSHQH